MHHVVITRFNVRLTADMQVPDEIWLRDRIQLFERFTAPSVHAQTVAPDRWIVFCDADSPSWLVDRLDRVASVRPVNGVFSPKMAAEAVSDFAGTLITTRLDNDDAIATHFIETVQREAPVEGFVNLSRGLELAGDRLFRRADLSNAFMSRVEHGRYETIIAAGNHRHIGDHFEIHQVETSPSWLQVIHDRNLVNTVSGMRTSRRGLRMFSVHADVTDRGLRTAQIRWLARAGARQIRRSGSRLKRFGLSGGRG